MKQFLSSNIRWLLPTAAVLAAGVAYLAFAVFGIHLLFIDDEVNEALPVFASGAEIPTAEPTTTGEGLTATTSAPTATTSAPTATTSAPTATTSAPTATTAAPTATTAAPTATTSAPTATTAAPTATTAAPTATTAAPSNVTVEYSGNFGDRSHPSSGVAQVLGDGSGQRFLRFEDFETDNGPDLNIYLSAAPADASAGDFDVEFVDLGDLKGNIGSQNYVIPEGVDLDRYSTVVIWCVRFRVAFGTAGLAAV